MYSNNRSNRFLLILAMPVAVLSFLPLCAKAQEPKPTPAPPAKAAPTPVFSLDLRSTRLRQALETLFNNAQAQYTLAEDLPDTPVTLVVRDQPLDAALRLLLQQAGGTQRVTYVKEAGVYRIQTKPADTVPNSSMNWEPLPLINVRPQDIEQRLQSAFPQNTILAVENSSSLLIHATTEELIDIRSMVRHLDIAPHNVLLKVEVVQVYSDGALKAAQGKSSKTATGPRSVLLSTVLRMTSGQEATGEDKLQGTPAQAARLQLTATPTRLGDSTYELKTRWQVSLPLSAAKTGSNGKEQTLIRLEKMLTNTTHLRPGDTNVVGGVILSQYDLKGEILFFVTLTEVADDRKQ